MLVGNVAVDLMDQQSAISLILGCLSGPGLLAVASANLDHIHHFADDESWCRRFGVCPSKEADALQWLTLLDGVPLVRTANALTGCVWPKLSGSDLICPILDSAASLGVNVGFLGGSEDTQRRLLEMVRGRLPDIRITGAWAPSRAELTDPTASERIAASIRGAGVDLLVTGLGKPLQENWIDRYGTQTGAQVMLAFGAVVDFLAGRIRRAPDSVVQAGAEWAWRLALEPRRLGRRYLVQGPPALVRLKRTARVVEAATTQMSTETGDAGRFVPPQAHAEVTGIVVTYNSESDIGQLVDDLRLAARERAIRLVVVDNESCDRTVEVLRSHDDIVVIEAGGNLGYSGGINVALRFVGNTDTVLILNPDLRLAAGAITHLLATVGEDRVGAVVPTILDENGCIFPSLRNEPSVLRATGDALFGTKIRNRPAWSSEVVSRTGSYRAAREADWATGAALLMPASVVRELGDWDESYFLYSEETDYFRRIRDSGRSIRYQPLAVVQHRSGGSGTSPALAALMAVNRIRYVERHHRRFYSTLFRTAVALGHALRCYDTLHRQTLGYVLRRNRWRELPHATNATPSNSLSGRTRRGAVIIPAYNEEAVIERTLAPLSQAAIDGYIELIVVCNGCTDRTAAVARRVLGVQVLELDKGSKPAALNAGDEQATLWPRLYLDADIQISITSVLAVLDRLAQGDAFAARPESRYESRAATALVRSYYRARCRVPQHKSAMWGAGAYGLSEDGHRRLRLFPPVTADDLYVDNLFADDEKVVVATEPSVVTTPVDVKSLLAVLRRNCKGSRELHSSGGDICRSTWASGRGTAVAVMRTVRGPQSAVDAMVYIFLAVTARLSRPKARGWERDESSRSTLYDRSGKAAAVDRVDPIDVHGVAVGKSVAE